MGVWTLVSSHTSALEVVNAWGSRLLLRCQGFNLITGTFGTTAFILGGCVVLGFVVFLWLRRIAFTVKRSGALTSRRFGILSALS